MREITAATIPQNQRMTTTCSWCDSRPPRKCFPSQKDPRPFQRAEENGRCWIPRCLFLSDPFAFLRTHLADHIHQRRLSILHDPNRLAEHLRQLSGERDRPRAPDAKGARRRGEVHSGLFDTDPVNLVLNRPSPELGHPLLMFLVVAVGAVAENHDEKRDAVMRSRPKPAERKKEVSIGLEINAELSPVFQRKGGAQRSWKAVTQAPSFVLA